MIVYVNGDSYTCVSDGKRYSEYLGEHFNCKSINAAIPGSCNSRILRTALRDLMALKAKDEDLIAVISLSFVLRTEVWNKDPSRHDLWKQSNDGDFMSCQFAFGNDWFKNKKTTLSKELPSKFSEYGKNWLIWYDIEAETTKLLQQIILFSTWCKFNKIKYVIFSGPLQEPVSFNAPFIKPFYDEIMLNPNIINIFDQSFTNWCILRNHTPIDIYEMQIFNNTYNCGHHGENAHKDWANFLIENYL